MTITIAAESVHTVTTGPVEAADVGYARTKVATALHDVRDPVLFARVKLTQFVDPALVRPAVAQVNVDLNGRLVRAQVARPTMREAIDEAHDRLRDRMHRAAGDWQAIRGSRPTDQPHEWRHTSHPTDRPPYFPRAAEERQVIRRKAFGLARMTVDEAVVDMNLLDYDFHLFTEAGSGVDSVLSRSDDGSHYRLAQTDPHPGRITPGTTPPSLSLRPAPRLSLEQAVEWLNAEVWPFVFFCDVASGRGCVLYHRYDGHYGVITPAG